MPKPIIKGLKNILKHIKQNDPYAERMFGRDHSQKYLEAIDRPDLVYPDARNPDYEALMAFAENPESITAVKLNELAAKYSIPFDGTLHRGLLADPGFGEDLSWFSKLAQRKPGDSVLLSKNPNMSTSMTRRVARNFSADQGYVEKLGPIMGAMAELDAKNVKALPIIPSAQDELVVPTKGWKATEVRRKGESDVRVKAKNYAKGGVVGALKNLKRDVAAEMANAGAPQAGFFSTLDELIQQAPINKPVHPDVWEQYLRPGRTLTREDVQFPLKAEELEYSGFNKLIERLRNENKLLEKDYLLNSVRASRPVFRLESRSDAHPRRNRRYNPKVEISGAMIDRMASQYAQQPPTNGYTALVAGPRFDDPRLRSSVTEIPGSYEESITRMPGLQSTSHFNDDDLSWSRTTLQPAKGGKIMRLVEEIQSDLHSKAGEKIIPPSYLSDELNDVLSRAGLGYSARSLEAGRMTLPQLQSMIENLELYKSIDPTSRAMAELKAKVQTGSQRRGYVQPSEPGMSPIDYAEANKGRMPDAPFKDPGDYGLLELKKQMLNSAYSGDDMIGITPAEVQIMRYEGGMGPERIAGMSHIYDRVNPSQLQKLARQYGAEYGKVPHELVLKSDARPPTLENMELETPDELRMGNGFEDVYEEDPERAEGMINSLINDYHRAGAFTDAENELMRKYSAIATKEMAASLRGEREELGSTYYDAVVDGLMKAHERYQELKGGHHFKDLEIPAMQTPEEIREKIKRIGVPLWSLPAAAVGAGIELSDEDKQEFAKGGVVQSLRDLKTEVSPWLYQRAERVFDESPDLANLYSYTGVQNLAKDYAPIVMFKPGEFRRYAEPFNSVRGSKNYVPEVDRLHAMNVLSQVLEEGGMNDTPFLTVASDSFEPQKLVVKDHEGRHRALFTGEYLHNKYPVHMVWQNRGDGVDTGFLQTTPRYHRELDVGSPSEASRLVSIAKRDSSYEGQGILDEPHPWITNFGDVEKAEEDLKKIIEQYNNQFTEIKQQRVGRHRPHASSREKPYKMKKGRAFKDGGVVKPKNKAESAFQRLQELTARVGIKGTEGRRRRLMTGLMSNVMGQDKEGNLAWPTSPFGWGEEEGVVPGIVDSTAQLAGLPSMLAQLAGVDVPVPEFAERASERSAQLQKRLRDLAGIREPKGFTENAEEAFGSMLTQVPVAGQLSKARAGLSGLRKLATGPLEYLSPVVEPGIGNYIAGGIGGGAFNTAIEGAPDALRAMQNANAGMSDEDLAEFYRNLKF